MWKLHSVQREIYQQAMSTPGARFVLECSRRLGKTWLLCAMALEICQRAPKTRVVFASSTLKALLEFILPALEGLSVDAPDDVRGKYSTTTGHWTLPNGSYLALFGADDKASADRGRGPEAAAAFVDEAGFFPPGLLTYVLKSIIRPQLLHSGGRTFIASTPSEIPEHDFTEIAERAQAQGNYAHRDVYANPMLSPERIEAFIADDAKDEGMSVDEYKQSEVFRREYMAERVINPLLVVIPEWESARGHLLKEVPRPEFFRGTSGMDWGGHDPHAGVFGYWHCELQAAVIEREFFMRGGEASDQLVATIKAIEGELWGTERYDGTLKCLQNPELQAMLDGLPPWMNEALYQDAPEQPFSRWGDTNIQLIRDLYTLHGLAVIPTAKDQLQLQTNELRTLIRQGKLYVHPSCVHTDRHLRTTTWENHKRKGFARRGGEHGDALAASLYWARNLDRADPTPKELRLVRPQTAQSSVVRAYMGGRPQARRTLSHG